MAINPLELQTLFSQINNAGKINSIPKDAELLKQEIANSEIVKKSEKIAEDVPETKNIDSDSSKINEKEREKKEKKKKNSNNNYQEKDEEEMEEEEKEKKSIDPYLGNKIDILG